MNSKSLAIFYHPDGYDLKNHQLMGRRVAGQGFLNAWIDRMGGGALHCFANTPQQFKGFCDIAKARGASGTATWIPQAQPEALKQAGALYFPGPDIGLLAWRRFKRAPHGWSLVGVTHTICTTRIMDGICDWATAPVESWDAVICTSKAAHAAITHQMATQREYLSRRLGATRFTDPQLPIIPLGIRTDDFAPDAALRAATRTRLGLDEAEIAVLFVGRLSRSGKTHPAPMLLAVSRAAAASGKKVRFLMAGQFAHPSHRDVLARDVAAWSQGVTVQILDGRDDDLYAGAWRAADVFISLIDNIQETFGLAPVEAMAAGLPVVVSDWDGYRDTVRDGVDGFRIPTIIPPAALGDAAVERYAANLDSYDTYLARTASMTVVDVAAAAAALEKLFNDAELRRTMGAAARARAMECYDWGVVLDAYEALLEDLAARRQAAAGPDYPAGKWPQRLSPFEMFAGFASHRLQGAEMVRRVPGASQEMLDTIAAAEGGIIGNAAAFLKQAQALLAALQQPVRLSSLLNSQPEEARGPLLHTMLLLAKFGLVSIDRA